MHALESAWEALKRDFDSACLQTSRYLVADLNQIFRRLRHYESEEQWVGALRDGVSKFAPAFAIFTQRDDVWVVRAHNDLNVPADLEIKSSAARGFAAALEARDPVVVLRSSGEVGEALSTESAASRAHLFSIANGERTVALIFVAGEESIDVNALELIAAMASSALERHSNRGIHSQIAPAPQRAVASVEKGPTRTYILPPWSNLSDDQQRLHARAQRFSRVAVAGMELSRPEACRAGREQSNFYMLLQAEIDKARENFRKQFMTIPSMVDYLHLELINTSAAGDEHKLGADYPGQLV